MLIVLDDDLIQYINEEKNTKLTMMLGTCIEWLVHQFLDLLVAWKEKLPKKARKYDDEPCVYWLQVPLHNGFDKEANEARLKYNLCIESVAKTISEMRIIKFKNDWDKDDPSFVTFDYFSHAGLSQYYRAIDAGFHFNKNKHELFKAKKTTPVGET